MGGTNDPFQFPPADSTNDPVLDSLTPASEVPDRVPRNDNTNPIIGGADDFNQIDPAELEKNFRNAGVTDPKSSIFRLKPDPENDAFRVVAETADGNEVTTLATGDRQTAQDVLDRAKQAQERVLGSSRDQQRQDPASGNPEDGIRFGPDAASLVEQLGGPSGSELVNMFMQGDGAVQQLIRGIQNGGEQQSFDPSQIAGLPDTQPSDPTQREDNQLPQPEADGSGNTAQAATPDQASEGDSSVQAAESVEPLTGPSAEPQSIQDLVTSAQPQQRQGESLRQLELDQITREGGDEQSTLQQIGEQLERPEVQEGLAQLAQLFVEPDSGTGQVARQLVQDAQRRQQASQIQQLVAGEDVEEPEAPSVLTTASELQSADSRRDLVEARTEKARLQGRLALQDAFSGEQTELDQGEVDDIVETVTSNMTGDVLSRVQEEETGLEAAGILQLLGKNPNPSLVRAFASDEQRQEMEDEIVSRLVATGMDREEAVAKFGDYKQVLDEAARGIRSAAGVEEEGGEDQQVPGSLSRDQAQTLSNGGTVQIGEGEAITLNGRTFGPGTLQVGDNGNIQHAPR